MKNRLVLYHSRTGNNRFLAEKIAKILQADIRPLNPRTQRTGWLYLLSLLKAKSGIRLTQKDLAPYDEVIVMGPIWGGLLIAPLREAIKMVARLGKPIHFATCCGSSDEDKEGRYGYTQVLAEAEKVGQGRVKSTEAFPLALVLTPEEYADAGTAQGTRLTEDILTDALRNRLKTFTDRILAQDHSVPT